jgi:2-keto-4-pentenoate hydratase/2-oxohepta-3-ene-1,7-dioic acid hydratase in catechol pathway
MIRTVARIIAEVSRGTTLAAGTVVLTGTPAGVGFGRKPPVFLRDGDVVEVEVTGVGRVRNPVRHG